MQQSHASAEHRPMMAMNTTPLIDVLLVLLVMMIITIPAATHTLIVDLPGTGAPPIAPDPVRNRLALTADGTILWNGHGVSPQELASLLKATRALPVEPELQFAPAPDASYDLAAKVMGMIKTANVTRFGFVDNDRFADFTKATP